MKERCERSAPARPAEIRELAEMLGIRPTKTLGQNFVIDPNTIRRIVNAAEISPEETVLEVGPAGFVDPRHPRCCEGYGCG